MSGMNQEVIILDALMMMMMMIIIIIIKHFTELIKKRNIPMQVTLYAVIIET